MLFLSISDNPASTFTAQAIWQYYAVQQSLALKVEKEIKSVLYFEKRDSFIYPVVFRAGLRKSETVEERRKVKQ